jgi:hypothetical protein
MERKKYFRKTRSLNFSVMILCCALPLLFAACTEAVVDQNEDIDQSDLPTFNRIDGGRLIAIAACKLFDDKKSATKNSIPDVETAENPPQTRASEADTEYFRLKYGFDYVKIISATRYTVKNADVPLVSEICGKGEIDVIEASFETYVSDKNGMQPAISDVLIVFKSEQGIYACMNNSGGEYAVYSSHKRFEQNAIVKDFIPPVYEFYIKNEKGTTMLSGSLIIAEDGSSQKETNLKWFLLQEQETASEGALFGIDELVSTSQIEQPCTVTEKGEGYFLTKGDSNLKQVYFDEYTEFWIKGKTGTHKDIVKGDKITVAFDKLYEKYNPKTVFANKIYNE